MAYKVEQEKGIASDLQKTLNEEQEKANNVRKLLVAEQNAVRDLKSELCECRQDNERLLKSLNDVQKEVLQLRCGPPARLPLLAVLSLGFWAKLSACCVVPTTFFPALK